MKHRKIKTQVASPGWLVARILALVTGSDLRARRAWDRRLLHVLCYIYTYITPSYTYDSVLFARAAWMASSVLADHPNHESWTMNHVFIHRHIFIYICIYVHIFVCIDTYESCALTLNRNLRYIIYIFILCMLAPMPSQKGPWHGGPHCGGGWRIWSP